MHIDLVKLTCDALIELGSDPSLIEELDHHAPIELCFDSIPPIRIEALEESGVILYCQLTSQETALDAARVADLLTVTAEFAPWVVNRAVTILDVEDTLHMNALVAPSHLCDGKTFSEALQSFYDRVVACNAVLQS